MLTIFSIRTPLDYSIFCNFENSFYNMKLPTLFKQNRNKKYSYAPRHWDERKERIENLRKEKAAGEKADYFNQARRKSFREDWRAAKSNEANKNSKVRFIIILIILLGIAYVAIMYGKIDLFA